jgi:hypothetical protein
MDKICLWKDRVDRELFIIGNAYTIPNQPPAYEAVCAILEDNLRLLFGDEVAEAACELDFNEKLFFDVSTKIKDYVE